MKLSRYVCIAAGVAAVAFSSLSLLPDSTANAKGKPGGGGGGGNTNFAFAFEDSGKIFATTIDDNNRVQLTFPKAQNEHISPSWSPDLDPDTPGYQGLIAYLELRDGGRDLYVTDGVDSLLVRAFPFSSNLDDPIPSELDSDLTLAWTPNGREIVFVSRSNRIVAVEVATGNHGVLLDFSADLGPDTQDVTISPLLIGYTRREDVWAAEFRLNEAGLIEVDETSIVKLTDTPATSDLACSFSRDGTYLSYSRRVDDPVTRWQVVVLDLLTGAEVVVLDGLAGGREVAWSPDGSQLCIHDVEQLSSGRKIIDLFRITDWDDSVNRRVIQVTTDNNGGKESDPDWNPGWIAP